MTTVNFLPVSVETGWSGHGPSPSFLYKGQGLAWLVSPAEEGAPLSS